MGSFSPSWARQSSLATLQFHRGENAIFEVSRGPKTNKNGSSRPTWPDLGLTWAHLASHGPTRGQLGPTWGQLGANLGPVWANFGPVWATLGPTWGDLGRLGPAWASSRPIGAQVRAMLGATWGHFGLNFGPMLGSTWRRPRSNRQPKALSEITGQKVFSRPLQAKRTRGHVQLTVVVERRRSTGQ